MGLARVSTMCSQDSGAVNQVWREPCPGLWAAGRGAGWELELKLVRGDLRAQPHLLDSKLSP